MRIEGYAFLKVLLSQKSLQQPLPANTAITIYQTHIGRRLRKLRVKQIPLAFTTFYCHSIPVVGEIIDVDTELCFNNLSVSKKQKS